MRDKFFVCVLTVVDQLPRLGKIELICLLLFTCNYMVFVWRGFLFLWVLGMGYVILLWHSLSLPYNYFVLFPSPGILLNKLYLKENQFENKLKYMLNKNKDCQAF